MRRYEARVASADGVESEVDEKGGAKKDPGESREDGPVLCLLHYEYILQPKAHLPFTYTGQMSNLTDIGFVICSESPPPLW